MEIRLEDFNKCCRCCLAMIEQDDGYPQQMCSRCVLKLSSSSAFYTMVMKNHKTLEEILKAPAKTRDMSASAESEAPRNNSNTSFETENVQIGPLKPSIDYSLQNKVPCDQIVTSPIRKMTQQNISIKSESESEGLSDKEDCYHCSQCEHTSENQEAFEDHLQTHLVKPKKNSRDVDACPHLCNLCGARFRWRTSLFKHLRRHRGHGYKCEVCQKVFGETTTLNVHMLSHSVNQKPYQCETCSRSFTQQSSLRRHVQTHDARSQLKCSDCDKSFLHKYSLLRHRENAHLDTECPTCKNIFKGKRLLETHMKLHEKARRILKRTF
ncbi:zinc finger protein OZF-like isoform X2 [Leguminivora glycinivorella]|uniref:zinc finger protein OZF-like isoform X2 n=1 Tax=Leguminivora glycinivorella TaxID=1035111 RepID=UPI0020104930|nr:zinc finger protein OZF-like isoform X2 [Leguminivora glycinivorella]XP_047994658.1 zinc finger protein OZF-like isoform X2 [Leguminivora glycinivorella]